MSDFGRGEVVYRNGDYSVIVSPHKTRKNYVEIAVSEDDIAYYSKSLMPAVWYTTIERVEAPWWNPFKESQPGIRVVLAKACEFIDNKIQEAKDIQHRMTHTLDTVNEEGANYIKALKELDMLSGIVEGDQPNDKPVPPPNMVGEKW